MSHANQHVGNWPLAVCSIYFPADAVLTVTLQSHQISLAASRVTCGPKTTCLPSTRVSGPWSSPSWASRTASQQLRQGFVRRRCRLTAGGPLPLAVSAPRLHCDALPGSAAGPAALRRGAVCPETAFPGPLPSQGLHLHLPFGHPCPRSGVRLGLGWGPEETAWALLQKKGGTPFLLLTLIEAR